MNRVLLPVPAAVLPLLVDASLKVTVPLALAAVCAVAMRRASAAARHMVWLSAVLASLLLPVLCAVLPKWRVLPEWAVVEDGTGVKIAPRAVTVPSVEGAPWKSVVHEIRGIDGRKGTDETDRLDFPPASHPQAARDTGVVSVAAPPSASTATVVSSFVWLVPVWAAGCAVLLLRLAVSHGLLRHASRRAESGDGRLRRAFAEALRESGVRQPVTLLVDSRRTIPVVWGVFRPRLLLPADAHSWGEAQLRSVFVHELAHVRRRDPLIQTVTQLACALHWFNPFVWFAAWRLHIERERACDDLVLASGVRPSEYAAHLLDVATQLSPARWTAVCGLAMARPSSLEGRLAAILSENLNRRGLTRALTVAAVLFGAVIAIPLAMLRAAESDKPKADAPAVNIEPKDPGSKALFEDWKTGARSDGKIPGGRIGEMAASLRTFMDLNPGHEQSVKLEPVLKKCDASHDWTPAEAAALLDEIAAITPRAEWTMRAITERRIHPGKPLPDELANAPWGQPAANGLRMAWLLEPHAETRALDSVMKSRVLFHNTGKAPVCFATEDWIQSGRHTAKDANGKVINIHALERMGIRTRMIFRLAPGEYAEVEGHGIGVGSHETSSEKSIYKVGCWIEAKEGDAVTFTPANVPVSFQTWINNEGLKDSVTVWREMIAARVRREGPMPASAADREPLLRRVMQDFPGTAPTAEEIAAFTADNAPDALAKLTTRLQTGASAMHFAGELSGGETKFRVIAAGAKEEPKQGADAAVQPKHEYAQSLFRKWQANARTDGKIPGALIGHVAREVDGFLKQHPDDDKASQLAALRPRLDASRDWTQEEVVTLLDDITAISTAPVSWADIPMEFSSMRAVKGGEALPIELTSAAWGQPMANGLRAAWLLEPRAEQYPLGSVLKARVLFHNAGKAPVVFKTETWHQADGHTARDAKGAEIKVGGSWFTGITPMATFRLAPGEYCEVKGHGIAIGAGKYDEEFSTGSVGAIIEAKEGDAVTLSHTVDTSYGGWSRPDDPKDAMELWKVTIAERIANEAPMPVSAADRTQLIRRVTLDILGVVPTAEEIAAFTADDAPDALAKLTARLQAKPRVEPFSGKLPTGETKFRVIAADPDAAKAPRIANSPGRYVLGDNAHLLVSQLTEGGKRTNKAVIAFLSTDPKVASPHQPFEIALPDGIGTYGIVWDRGSGALWVMQKALVRKYDFANPAQVQEVRYEPGSLINIPAHMHDALGKAFDVPGAPVQQQNSQRPKDGATLGPATEPKLKWGEPVNGLRMALAWPPTLGEPGLGDAPEFCLVVQNVSEAGIRVTASDSAPNPRQLMIRDNSRPLSAISDPTPMPGDWLLQPREVAFLRLFQPGEKTKDGRTTSTVIEQDIRTFPQYSLTAEMSIEKAPAGAWTGQLATAETRGSVDVIPPKNKYAQALLKSWTTAARADGKIPGALIGALAEDVKTFIKSNPTWPTTPQLEKMLPRFDATRDSSGPDAVALLDELAAVQDSPISAALDHEDAGIIRTGAPLPADLADAPWGEALTNGLRLAYLLEPRAAEHRLNTPLKGRILIHNAGKEPVVFRTRGWHQPGHTAHDANGAEITVDSTFWTTLGRLTPFRLAPGEFVEVNATGIGVGANRNPDDWQNTRVGSWLDVKPGDEVTVTTNPLPLSDWNEGESLKLDGEPRWWLDHITARLSRHLPFPADKAGRELLLYRVAIELFGTPVSAEINAAFVADPTPTALDSLAKSLFHRPGQHAWAGPLQSAPTKFRVLPADPEAAKRPRTATNPGEYTLSGNVTLKVIRRPVGERLVNEASLRFSPPDATQPAPRGPHNLDLPDGYDTWAAAWVRGETELWVAQKGLLRKVDFADSAKVEETRFEGDNIATAPIPRDIHEVLRAALGKPGAAGR